MGLFELNEAELLTFFCVLVRFSVIIAVFPLVGSMLIPAPIKILLSLSIAFVLYPVLLSRGLVNPQDTLIWASSAYGIAKTVVLEVVFALGLGFVMRIIFDAIQVAGDVSGNLMGLAAASQFDPMQESQTQVVSKTLGALAMLLFLAIDGHHVMLQGALESYRLVAIGGGGITGAFAESLIRFSGEVLRIGVQLAAPMAVSTFAINIVYAVLARAMPQLHILVLSFSVSALVGLFVTTLSLPYFQSATRDLFEGIDERMMSTSAAMRSR